MAASATRETRCGYLTVPEDRADPSGRKVRLFIVRLEPNKQTTAPPVVYVGSDIGVSIDFFALAAMADHFDGPEVIGIEPRGTGYSDPNLSCPEVDAISAQALEAPITDAGVRRSFIDAVATCHERFAGLHIDLSAYGVEQSSEDLLDLVQALGLKDWDVVTKGSTSRFVLEALRAKPSGLRSFIAMYPEFPNTDVFAQAIQATRTSVSELARLCDADDACARSFPRLAATFDEAIRRFDADPRTVRVDGTTLVVDGARLLRDFRNLMGTIQADDPMYRHLPATIDALAHAKDPDRTVAAVVAPELSAPTFCAGYLPVCTSPTSQGAYYTALCADIVPFVDFAALRSLAGGADAWGEDYVDGPYRDVCGAWKVEPADGSVATTVESDVPMLVFSGGLSPYVTPDAVREGIAGIPHAFLVVTPMRSHAVATIPPCAQDEPRNEFLADPTSAPDTRCEEGFEPSFAGSPLSQRRETGVGA